MTNAELPRDLIDETKRARNDLIESVQVLKVVTMRRAFRYGIIVLAGVLLVSSAALIALASKKLSNT